MILEGSTDLLTLARMSRPQRESFFEGFSWGYARGIGLPSGMIAASQIWLEGEIAGRECRRREESF